MRRWAIAPLLALLLGSAPHGSQAPDAARPAILVHCPRPSVDQWGAWVDLRYIRELRERGLDVDYTDRHADFTWERVRDYDVIVLYVCPLERGRYYGNTPDRPPYRDAFVDIVERFLQAGGGVLVLAHAINADESFVPLIGPWGARIAYERIAEMDSRKLAPLPRMSGAERLWFTNAVANSPVSAGVEQVWLPLTDRYAAAETMPIVVSDPWQVVLRGSPTSRSVPIDPQRALLPRPLDAVVRPAGVAGPDLFAIREYAAGRIALGAIWPQYSLGQGTEWLYERRVLSEGIDGRPSHFGRLLENTLRWLAEPALAARRGRRPTFDPLRLVPPNERPGVAGEFVRRSLERPANTAAALAATRGAGRLYRGLIGAQSRLGSGAGSVARHAAAARAAGLDFVVFLEDLRALDAGRLAALRAQCARHSDSRLRLFPGYWVETNADNRIFFFGDDVTLPPPELRVGERLNQQYQDPRTGTYQNRPLFIEWLNYRLLAAGGVNVGYFGFADGAGAQPIHDLRLSSVVALVLYRDGRLVEDNLTEYLLSAAGTLPPAPVAVHFVRSPVELRRAGRGGRGLTYAAAPSVDKLWEALRYAGPALAPNVSASDGPRIEAWPAAYRYYTFGAEDFVARAAWMPSPLVISSDVGLAEIRLYDGDRLYRRFHAGGSRRFERVLELGASVQKTLVVVAEDVDGGRAVGSPRRCWKGGDLAPTFCPDRINDCDLVPLLAKGPGVLPVSRVPPILAGETWDGGPRGERPILQLIRAERPTLVSDLGREGTRGFLNRPRLELADEGAVRVRTVLERLYDARIPVISPWQTFGPLGGPSRLLRAEGAFTAFARPSAGPHPYAYAGFPVRRGAAVSLFENHIEFRRAQTVESLLLFLQRWYTGPLPVGLVHGRGDEVLGSWELPLAEAAGEQPRLATGDWIGVWAPEPSNLSVHVNRGEPLRLELRGRDGVGIRFRADLDGATVRAGERRSFELLSVVDPLDEPERGLERVLRIVRRLQRPEGLRVQHGRLRRSAGLVELDVQDGFAALRVDRPDPPARLPLALRVHGLDPSSSAGLFLVRGWVLGHYGTGRERYREAAVDEAGRAYVTLFPDLAETTEARIGHPVVCDPQGLFVQVTLADERAGRRRWHVSVNNPTDRELRVRCRATMDLPGLSLDEAPFDVPAGGYVVLR